MSFLEVRRVMANFWFDNSVWAAWDKHDWRKLECQLGRLQKDLERSVFEKLRTKGDTTPRETLEDWARKATLAKEVADTLVCWQRETEALGN